MYIKKIKNLAINDGAPISPYRKETSIKELVSLEAVIKNKIDTIDMIDTRKKRRSF